MGLHEIRRMRCFLRQHDTRAVVCRCSLVRVIPRNEESHPYLIKQIASCLAMTAMMNSIAIAKQRTQRSSLRGGTTKQSF